MIENLTFRDLGANVIAIRIANCANVTIRAVDFWNVAQGVFAIGSSNITIVDSRYQNITGPYERVGLNRGNFVQFDSVNGGLIARNKGRCGDTEDVVSLYKTSNVIVERNHFEGGDGSPGCLAWRSPSGSGIGTGDIGGGGNIVRNNVLVNPGQVGTFISGGTNNTIRDNIVIGEQRPLSNIGIYVENYSSGACSGHTVAGNRVRWLRADGQVNGGWTSGRCGTVAGWSTNNWNDTSLRAADYRVTWP